LIFRYSGIRNPGLCLTLTLLSGTLLAQEGAGNPAQSPAPAPAPASQSPTGATQSKKPAEPDYPDPRTLSIGVFYWLTLPGTGPDVRGGIQATGYSSLFDLGKDKPGPAVDIRFPITRTGELRFEGFLSKGTGSQLAPLDTTLFGNLFSKGDYLATQYQITSGKLYLDDLLYPFKFPVSKFRLKSLWALRYLVAKSTIDGPLNVNDTTATGNRQIILPEFGIAAEYALLPHLLLRVEGSGFGIPRKSYVWDGAATVSYRLRQWSVEGGFKALGFKTTPNKDEYVGDILQGGFVGIRYNWK
jgi:hypothetical protein